MNVIPILAEYPTMRVLLQNTHVSVNNVASVLKTLKEMIDAFKRDLGKFRKKLTIKRSKMGYELDVREDHTQSVAESVESNFKLQNALDSPTSATKSRKGSLSRPQQPHSRHARNKSISSKQQPKKSDTGHNASKKSISTNSSTHHHHHHHHHHRHSSSSLSATTVEAGPSRKINPKDKKDVWGVGKTGSSLSYILRAGSFALSLLPKNGQPSLILLTDGVVKSNIQDESVIRQLTADNISCSVVQIGQDKGFFPGLNFGFVPDNEILEFVTLATNGVFTFAENCPAVPNALDEGCNSMENLFFMPPNIYHHRYMLKEINLDHSHSSRLLRKNKENGSGQSQSVDNDASSGDNTASLQSSVVGAMAPGTVPHFGRRAFPWDPMSIPIAEDLGKLKFKEYFLPTECWHFMRARLGQGFVLQSVSFIDEPKSTAISGKSASTAKQQQQAVDGLPNFQKKQNVVIVFILRWQPNITVQYSIKALWTSSLRYHLKSMSLTQEKLMNIPEEPPNMLDNDNIFSCMRVPKAEIVIKSTSTFSHMLHNWDQFQRRSQMMAVQGGNATIDLASAPGFIKVGKMKRLLERLADTDSMLKQLVQFNIIDKGQQALSGQQLFNNNNSLDASILDWSSQLNYIQKFSSHWAKLERSELRTFNACWYDEHYFNVIIGDAADYKTNTMMMNGMEIDQVQVALNQIYDKLHRWSTFMSEDQQVYVKLLNVGETVHAARHQPAVETSSSSNKRPYTNTSNSNKKHIVPQFCEVRVVRETDRVLLVKLMFFNADIRHRHYMVEELQDLVQSNPMVDSVQTLNIKSPNSLSHGLGIAEEEYYMDANTVTMVTKRPLSSLIMRDSSHFLPPQQVGLLDAASKSNSSGSSQDTSSSKSLWSVNPSMQLTGEFLVRNYLHQYTWHWDTQDVLNDKQMFHRYFSPIIHLAFDHIMAVRSDQVSLNNSNMVCPQC